ARRRTGEPPGLAGALLADLSGDLAAVLGVAEPAGPGLAGWLAAGDDVPADALARLEHQAAPGVGLLPRGSGGLPSPRAHVLAGLLAADPRPVVVDCGRLVAAGAAATIAASSTRSLLVTRACYLALRRASQAPVAPSGVVLVTEPGRSLGRRDVEEVTGAPVVAELALDPAVARAVDAGILAARLPRSFQRALRAAA
ncbi:MAG: ATPase involved in chromosome partitioning, partial [Acidimicrobiales bacterium]|nr:ATPase involved in chromosome partitioning [Acidimicrobiales bacterium]